MLSPYRGNAAATSPQASNKPIAVSISGALPASNVFAAPTTVTHAATPYTIADATSGTTPPERSFLADTSGGVLTINLPATPIAGEIVNVKRTTTDGTALTIARNGKKIEGAAADFVDANAALSTYSLQYDSTSGSWWII